MAKSVTQTVVIGTIVGILAVSFWGRAASARDRNPSSAQVAVTSLPLQAQAAISQSLGRELPGFEVRAAQSGSARKFETVNAKQHIAAEFSAGGVSLRTGGVDWGMALEGYGYRESLTPAVEVAPCARKNRVEYRRALLTEWYANGPLGLEQGFTLSRRPAMISASRGGHGPLTIDLALRGDVGASVDRDGAGLAIVDKQGKPTVRYSGLTAFDARGKRLATRMELRGHELLLKVDDAAARYPVVIDPIVQIATITGQTNLDDFGFSMALSGTTLAIGAPTYPVNAYSPGRVFIFVEPPGGWTNTLIPTATLVPSGKYSSAFLGISVAISGDTVAATASSDRSDPGGVYLYVKPAAGWKNMSESAVLSGSDGAVFESVSMTGNTITAGSPFGTVGSNTEQGAVYVWVKPAGGWTSATETAKLTASDGQANDSLGQAVAISGNTVVAGAPNATVGSNSQQGAGYVFVKPASGWVNGTETAKLTAADGTPVQVLGQSAAISGNTIVLGAPATTINGNASQGAAYIFVAPLTGWVSMTSTAKLTASDGGPYDDFGGAVAISGSTLVAGAPGATVNNVNEGTAYLFAKPKNGWRSTSNFNAKLIPSDLWTQGGFGTSVLVTGAMAWAGAPGAYYEIGEVYLFGTP